MHSERESGAADISVQATGAGILQRLTTAASNAASAASAAAAAAKAGTEEDPKSGFASTHHTANLQTCRGCFSAAAAAAAVDRIIFKN